MNKNFVSLDDFKNSRVWVSDINKLIDTGTEGEVPGWIYWRSYWIEDYSATEHASCGPYVLALCNTEHRGGDLASLEELLYAYAAREESWVTYQNVELRVRIRVPHGFDEKRLDGMLSYIEDALLEEPIGENIGSLIEGESSWIYYKDI